MNADRTSTKFTPSRIAAPSSPPVSELSFPITAFCTTFESRSRTTRSNEFSCASCRFPATCSRTSSAPYTATVRIAFSAGEIPMCATSCHTGRTVRYA
jgi:hypothetical protein